MDTCNGWTTPEYQSEQCYVMHEAEGDKVDSDIIGWNKQLK